MLNIGSLNAENIEFVVNHLSERSLMEMDTFGVDKLALRIHLDSFIRDRWSLCFYQDKMPCAILRQGSSSVNGNSPHLKSMFLFVEGIKRATWKSMTKALKELATGAVKNRVSIEFQAVVGDDDTFIDRWYRSLGATVRSEQGGIKTYCIGQPEQAEVI